MKTKFGKIFRKTCTLYGGTKHCVLSLLVLAKCKNRIQINRGIFLPRSASHLVHLEGDGGDFAELREVFFQIFISGFLSQTSDEQLPLVIVGDVLAAVVAHYNVLVANFEAGMR